MAIGFVKEHNVASYSSSNNAFNAFTGPARGHHRCCHTLHRALSHRQVIGDHCILVPCQALFYWYAKLNKLEWRELVPHFPFAVFAS
jgi:hypothetical protein